MDKIIATAQTLSGIATIEHKDGSLEFVKPGLAIHENDKLNVIQGVMTVGTVGNRLLTVNQDDDLNEKLERNISVLPKQQLKDLVSRRLTRFKRLEQPYYPVALDIEQQMWEQGLGLLDELNKPRHDETNTPPAFTINNEIIHLHNNNFYPRTDALEHLTAAYILTARLPAENKARELGRELLLNHLPLQTKSSIVIEKIKWPRKTDNIVGFYTFDEEGKVNPESIRMITTKKTIIDELQRDVRLGIFLIEPSAGQKLAKRKIKDQLVFFDGDFYCVQDNQNYTPQELTQRIVGNYYFTHNQAVNKETNRFVCGTSKWLNERRYNDKVLLGFEALSSKEKKRQCAFSLSLDIGDNLEQLFSPSEHLIANVYDEGSLLSHVVISSQGFMKGDRILFLPHSDELFEVDLQRTKHHQDLQIIISSANQLKSIQEFSRVLERLAFAPSTLEASMKKTESTQRLITIETYDENGLSDISEGCFEVLIDDHDSQVLMETTELISLGSSDEDFFIEDEFLEFKTVYQRDSEDSMYTGTGNLDEHLLDSIHQDYWEEIDLSEFDHQLSLSIDDVMELTRETQACDLELFNGETITVNALTILGDNEDVITLEGEGWTKISTTQGDLYQNTSTNENKKVYVLLAFSSQQRTLPKACVNYNRAA